MIVISIIIPVSRSQAIALVASLVVGALLWTKRKKSLAVITMSKVGQEKCIFLCDDMRKVGSGEVYLCVTI